MTARIYASLLRHSAIAPTSVSAGAIDCGRAGESFATRSSRSFQRLGVVRVVGHGGFPNCGDPRRRRPDSGSREGTDLTRLTHSPGPDFDPSWSPDGTQIAFRSERSGQPEVWVMNADGTGQRQLAAGLSPAWSPDGSLIAFSGRAGLSVIRPDDRPSGSAPHRGRRVSVVVARRLPDRLQLESDGGPRHVHRAGRRLEGR